MSKVSQLQLSKWTKCVFIPYHLMVRMSLESKCRAYFSLWGRYGLNITERHKTHPGISNIWLFYPKFRVLFTRSPWVWCHCQGIFMAWGLHAEGRICHHLSADAKPPLTPTYILSVSAKAAQWSTESWLWSQTEYIPVLFLKHWSWISTSHCFFVLQVTKNKHS